MRTTIVPSKDGELLTWTQNISTHVSAAPSSFGATAPQAAAFATVVDGYATAYAIAINPATRTTVTIADKNTARTSLKAAARLFVKLIESYPALTDGQRELLGLNIPNPPTPSPIPSTKPVVVIKAVEDNIVDLLLMSGEPGHRGKPAHCVAAMVYSFVGQNPPASVSNWKFEGLATKVETSVQFSVDLPAFSRVWITAQWTNRRGETGPAAVPQSVNLGTWLVQEAA